MNRKKKVALGVAGTRAGKVQRKKQQQGDYAKAPTTQEFHDVMAYFTSEAEQKVSCGRWLGGQVVGWVAGCVS